MPWLRPYPQQRRIAQDVGHERLVAAVVAVLLRERGPQSLLGIGAAFVAFGLPVVKQAAGRVGVNPWPVYLAIAWQLGSWWPHDNFHMATGMDLGALLLIEYGFHVTLIVTALVVARFFLAMLRPACTTAGIATPVSSIGIVKGGLRAVTHILSDKTHEQVLDPRSLIYMSMSAVKHLPDVAVKPPQWVVHVLAFVGRRLGYRLDT